MRVAHVIESLGRGGAEQALANVAPELVRRGHDVEVIALGGAAPLRAALEEGGVEVYEASIAHRWSAVEAVRKVRERVLRRADVVHTHMYFADVYVGGVRSLGGPPCVSTLHNLAYEQHPTSTPWRWLRRSLHAAALRRSFGARIAVSQAVADHYQAALSLPPPEVIPNGLPTRHFRARPSPSVTRIRKEQGVDPDSPLVVLPGRLVPEKGHAVLFDSLAMLSRPPVVVCAGGGPLAPVLEAEVERRGLSRHVRLVGSVDHERMLDLMQASDAVVLPSISEGLPLALAEALALGRPVVASSVGGVPTLVRHEETGLLVRPGDAEGLAAALERVLGDRSFAQSLGNAGQDHVDATMSVRAVVDALLRVYERVKEPSAVAEA